MKEIVTTQDHKEQIPSLEGNADRAAYLEYLAAQLNFTLDLDENGQRLVATGSPNTDIPRKALVHYMLATLELSEKGDDPEGTFATRMFPGKDFDSLYDRVTHLLKHKRTVWISTALTLQDSPGNEDIDKFDQYSKLFKSIQTQADFDKIFPELCKIIENDTFCWFKVFPQDNNDLQAVSYQLFENDFRKNIIVELWPGHTPRDFDPDRKHELFWAYYDYYNKIVFANDTDKVLPLIHLLANLDPNKIKKIDILLNSISLPNTTFEGMAQLRPNGLYELAFLNDFDMPHEENKQKPVKSIIDQLIGNGKKVKQFDFAGMIKHINSSYLTNFNNAQELYKQLEEARNSLRLSRSGTIFAGKSHNTKREKPTQTSLTTDLGSIHAKLEEQVSKEQVPNSSISPLPRPPKKQSLLQSHMSTHAKALGAKRINTLLDEAPIERLAEIIYESRLHYFTIKHFYKLLDDFRQANTPEDILQSNFFQSGLKRVARHQAEKLLKQLELERKNGNKDQ